MGELIIAREEDFFHSILINEKIKEWGTGGQAVVQQPQTQQDMSVYTYRTFTGENTAILHIKNPRLLNQLHTFDFDYWNIIIYIEQQWTPDERIKGKLGERLTLLPFIHTYQEKQDFFKERIRGYKFEKGMQTVLLRNLTRDPSQYDTIISYLRTKEGVITLEDLQYILGDVDLYNLEEFLITAIYGDSKRKAVWMLDYFLHNRGYAGHWVYGKLRDTALLTSYLYTMHRNGIFNRPMTVGEYKQRAEAMGIPVKDDWLRFRTQEVIIAKYQTEGQQVLNKRVLTILQTRVTTDNDLYGLLLKLRDIK